MPGRGLHVGAAYALEVVAQLPEVQAIHQPVRLRPRLHLLGVIHHVQGGEAGAAAGAGMGRPAVEGGDGSPEEERGGRGR